MLSSQQSGEQLVTKDRQLVYKGILKLLDNKAKACLELHAFLFTDLLLFTNLTKATKKEVGVWYRVVNNTYIYIYKTCSFFSLIFYVYIIQSNQLIRYKVYGHPLFLDSIELHDIAYNSTHKHVITIVEKTALQQKIQVYSLQAASKDDKVCIPKITIDMY